MQPPLILVFHIIDNFPEDQTFSMHLHFVNVETHCADNEQGTNAQSQLGSMNFSRVNVDSNEPKTSPIPNGCFLSCLPSAGNQPKAVRKCKCLSNSLSFCLVVSCFIQSEKVTSR